jgi:hypothetical protein
MVSDYTNNKTKTEFECGSSHHWSARPDDVLNGHGCPYCARVIKLSKDEVNNRIVDRGIKMTSEYVNNLTKADFECVCGEKWSTTPNSIMSGHGCSACVHYSFNPKKPAWIYVLKFANFIKYGITNNLNSRMKTHLRMNGEFEIVFTKFYDLGRHASEQEKIIKMIHGGKFVAKEICPDGWTETLSLEKLQSLLETIQS